VRTWGARANAHFRQKHLLVRSRMAASPAMIPGADGTLLSP